MALTFAELESVTNKYFMADGGMAVDIYFYTSFLLNWGLKQQKGIWERPDGGEFIMIPVEYDEQAGGFYSRGDTLDSDDKTSLNSARFDWKHVYGNATVYRIDNLKNAGVYAQVKIATQRVKGAQKTITKKIANTVYNEPGGSDEEITGMMACCQTTTTTPYANIQEADLVSEDGTTPWKGRRNTTGGAISTDKMRTLRSTAKMRDGEGGKVDLLVTTETLWNVIASILQLQQRFVKDDRTAHAGFTGIEFEGAAFFPDDFMPSGTLMGINSNYYGWAVHTQGYYMRTKWEKIPNSAEDKSMKIFLDGNQVVSNRRTHMAYTGLT